MKGFKGTKGNLTVKFIDKFPFYIDTVNDEGEVVFSERLHAHSTEQKNFNDALEAVGFDNDERPRIKKIIQTQIADAKLRASAPELLDVLQDILNDGLNPETYKVAQKAISKALD